MVWASGRPKKAAEESSTGGGAPIGIVPANHDLYAVDMWVFPLAAGAVASVFALRLAGQFSARGRPYQLLWAIAMLMYAAASVAVVFGLVGGWTPTEYQVFWVL